MANRSWRDGPPRMEYGIANRTAVRIGEHVRTYGLETITLVIHGGEPLLAGRELISHLVTATRSAVGSAVAVNAKMQTNAIGLDNEYL